MRYKYDCERCFKSMNVVSSQVTHRDETSHTFVEMLLCPKCGHHGERTTTRFRKLRPHTKTA